MDGVYLFCAFPSYEEHGKSQKWTRCMNQRELDNDEFGEMK
jgi:hypothetical protein